MCGIFGYIGKENINLKGATDIIAHRGPDAEGFLQYYPKSGNIIRNEHLEVNPGEQRILFGFRRLSIIDLNEHANQPFSDPSEKYHLIFNGEIYNYIEIRKELEALDYQFRTQSDTEVLLNAYICWGKACVQKFNGMWAFCIMDLKEKKLFCARDRFGIKPLYYYKDKGFYIASEIKQFFKTGLTKNINPNLIRDLLDKLILDHTDQTFFQGVMQLPAGHYLEIPLDSIDHYAIAPYWTLEKNNEYEGISYQEGKKVFKELFFDSIKLRFRSDVAVGSCLSGGLDSSSIVSVASTLFDFPIKTFTSRFDIAAYDETKYAKLLPEKYSNISPQYCQLTERKFEEDIDKVLFHQDEPFAGMGVMAQWEVMKLANAHQVPVLLDGQGGDELLAGYRKFYAFYLKEKILKGQFKRFTKEFFYLLKNKEFNFFDIQQIKRYLGNTPKLDFYSEEGKGLMSTANIGLRAANDMNQRTKLDVERFSYPVLLRYEDRNSMAFSIETRVPFMDYRLVEFLYNTSSDFKIRNGFTKAILRDSLNGTLPTAIKNRINKLGFATPQDIWMGTTLKPYFRNYFDKMNNPWLDNNKIAQVFKHYEIKSSIPSSVFFTIFCFDKWYQSHFGV